MPTGVINAWGHGRPLDVAAQFEQRETLETMLAFATPMQRLLSACRRADATSARTLLREYPDLIATMGAEQHRAITDAAWQGTRKRSH